LEYHKKKSPLQNKKNLTTEREMECLSALRNGDEKALREIFNQHYPLMVSDIYRIIPDEDTCKDLAQEVLVELWKRKEAIEVHSSLRAYLRRSALNKALTYLKNQRKIQLEGDDQFADTLDSSAFDLALQDKQEALESALHAAIDRLPEKCRQVFALSRFENMSHKEIAETLGISVKTIENQITKAMKLLRDALTILTILSSTGIL
jgi:RNA polymerase sigma-70 factor (ECF subfamily)